MRSPNVLEGLELDRAAHLRGDAHRCATIWDSPATRVLLVWRSKHLIEPGDPPSPAFLEGPVVDDPSCRVLLGLHRERAYFAVDLSDRDDPLGELSLSAEASFLGLREVAALLPREQGALLAYANGMMSWHRRHAYCGLCGSRTLSGQAGHVRECQNPACGQLHFPRTDPAVIMRISDPSDERLLLGRQSSWPPKVYSTLAGFVEPGEGLEEAVAREVREETGVEVSDIRYHSSQPWPFPSSLMLGFTARARSGSGVVHLQQEELEDARWFTRRELAERDEVELPSSISIARRLIEDWLG